MNQPDCNEDQVPTECVEDLQLTNQQAEETRAGRSSAIELEDCLVSNWSKGASTGN